MITTVSDLTEEGIYNPPKNDYDGHFLYVSARDGYDTDSTTLATTMLNTTVTGCLGFYFNIYVSSPVDQFITQHYYWQHNFSPLEE